MAATAGEFIGRLFFYRNLAHKSHLLTGMFARHKGLDAFYNDIIDLSDRFAEAYMGKYGRPSPDEIKLTWGEPDGDIQGILKSNVEWVEASKAQMVGRTDTFLLNIIDEIIELHYSTLYRLTLS
jgi:hypothetical protein